MRPLFLLGLMGLIVACTNTEVPKKPSNIILIMADDLGYEVLGCNGSTEYNTPNLDKMADSGLRFTNFHSTPLCTPSRVQLMTGKYNHRNYIGFGLLDPNEKTIAHYMKEAGYKTAVAGKWQLYGNATQQKLAGGRTGSLPDEAGFDEWCLWQVKDRGWRYKSPTLEVNGELIKSPEEYGPGLFSDFITDFMGKHTDSSFFIYYPMALVHDPFEPVPSNADYNSFERPLNDTTYFGDMVSEMDKIVGEIVGKAEELDIMDNTVIIFLGDNGTDRKVISEHESGSIPGQKGKTVKYGTHVPFIAIGADVKTGTFEGLSDLTDILPTVLELAGMQPDSELDGNSLLNTFQGSRETVRDWIYCYYHPNWGRFTPTEYAFSDTFKLYSDGTMFRYQDDPYQLDTLPDTAFPHERKALRKVLADMAQKKPD